MRTIGELLRHRRVAAGQSLAQAAQHVGLPQGMLVDLENDDLSFEEAHARAYVRMYARHLGLDAEALLRSVDLGPEVLTGAGSEALAHRLETDANTHTTVRTPPTDARPLVGAPVPARRHGWRRQPVAVGLLVVVTAGAMAVAVAAGGAGRTPTVELTPPRSADDEPNSSDSREPEAEPRASASASPAPSSAPISDAPDTDAQPTVQPATTAQPTPEPPLPDTPPGTRAPQDTRVQVLYSGSDQAVIDEVVATLESMGYGVAFVMAADLAVEQTTVLYTDGWQAEATALRDRDGRFAAVEANRVFSTEVDLHVAIGPDWPGDQQ